MNILVAYASKHGSTADIGAAIASGLNAMGHVVEARSFSAIKSLAPYDAAVLGSAVYMGSWLPDAGRFVERYAQELTQMPVWLFSSGPLGDPPVPVDEPAGVAPLARKVHAREHHVFAGRLIPSNLGLGERLATKVVKAPAGDYRNWAEVQEWAQSIGEFLSRSDNLAPVGSP